MKKEQNFDTIWRKIFSPKRVVVSQDLYKEYLPLVDVIPYPVYDENVIDSDFKFQDTISNSYHRICNTASRISPYTYVPTIKQLIDQLALIISGEQDKIYVIRSHRVIKSIPIDDSLLKECRIIQMAIVERLLLFEDMRNICQDKDADDIIEKTYSSKEFRDHQFIRGTKVDALISLAKEAINASKKVVVFVRNIPVCESLFQALVDQGFRVNIVHGAKDVNERRIRIDEFKKGLVDILIATRMLYGRGFDLPQADMAIFYSPKESEVVMWQEMLRMRSTFVFVKEVYLLFYSWTTEATKIVRLLSGMMETNAQWLGNKFRWAYYATEIPHVNVRKPLGKSKQLDSQKEKQIITNEFIQSVKKELLQLFKYPLLTVREYLDDLSDKTGMTRVWPAEMVRVLNSELSSTICFPINEDKNRVKWILHSLTKVMHPDKHPNAIGIEKEFWHEPFIGLELY